MRTFYRICDGITTAMSYVGMVVISMMVVLVFVDVLMRKVFSFSIIGVTEMTQMLWVLMVLGWGRSIKGPDNLRIDLVVDLFPQKARHAIDAFVTLVMIAACAVIAWRVFQNAMYNRSKEVYYSLLDIQVYPFIIIISVGYLSGCIGLLRKLATDTAALLGFPRPDGTAPAEGGADK